LSLSREQLTAIRELPLPGASARKVGHSLGQAINLQVDAYLLDDPEAKRDEVEHEIVGSELKLVRPTNAPTP
jgi:hypothetical protein